jgi:hypothetical protein
VHDLETAEERVGQILRPDEVEIVARRLVEVLRAATM